MIDYKLFRFLCLGVSTIALALLLSVFTFTKGRTTLESLLLLGVVACNSAIVGLSIGGDE